MGRIEEALQDAGFHCWSHSCRFGDNAFVVHGFSDREVWVLLHKPRARVS